MKTYISLFLMFTSLFAFAQNAPIDFEPGGFGADFTWATFEAPEGEIDPTFSVVPNISIDDDNPSETVAKMDISYGTNAVWGSAGCETMHGSDVGPFTITQENSTVSLQFYQVGFAAPVALKFATTENAAYAEVIVQNTIADAWVTVEFDMSIWINSTLPGILDQVIFFPSYGPRNTGHVVYFDNVEFGPSAPGPGDPMTPAPDPNIEEELVLSVYSDYYPNNNVSQFKFNAFQGAGIVSQIQIDGNNTGKIEDLTFYGADWTEVDINEFDMVHFDYYARNSTGFGFYVINASNGIPGGSPSEPRYTISSSGGDETILEEQWVRVSIPLQFFEDFPTPGYTYTLDAVNQYKFEGNGDIFFDNIFFSKSGGVNVNELPESTFKTFPNPTHSSWTISAEKSIIEEVILYDLFGKQVALYTPKTMHVILDGEILNSGLYFARISTENGIGTIKLIKE